MCDALAAAVAAVRRRYTVERTSRASAISAGGGRDLEAESGRWLVALAFLSPTDISRSTARKTDSL